MGRTKFTIEYIKQYFTDNGCRLLETEYTNTRTKMKYQCKCGNESYIKFDGFKQGNRCVKCGGNEKFTIDYVKQFFADNECELLETEYKNVGTRMNYKCRCGYISKIDFSSFKQGHRCKNCSIRKNQEKQKHPYESVRKYFIEQNCELLETEYKNNSTPMKFKCSCGNIHASCFKSFKKGHRCTMCGIEKRLKSQLRYKDYMMPSGEVRRVQGFEFLALDE